VNVNQKFEETRLRDNAGRDSSATRRSKSRNDMKKLQKLRSETDQRQINDIQWARIEKMNGLNLKSEPPMKKKPRNDNGQ
jgi:hypothetical protein